MFPCPEIALAFSLLLGVIRPTPHVPSLTVAAPGSLRFVYLGVAADDAALGALLGVEEAARTAALVSAAAPVLTIDSTGHATASAAAARTASASAATVDVTAFIGGDDEASCDAGLKAAAARGALFMALRCGPAADSAGAYGKAMIVHGRDTTSFALTFHMGLVKDGELWQASREAFGAAQLNDRFRARFKVPMSSSAWAGWMAVKIVTESAMRTHSNDPRTLATYMLDSTTRFDGHKGSALRFSPADHRLMQPIYRGNP